MNKTVLITNNRDLCASVRSGRFVEGSSLAVLVAVRTSIHLGSPLLPPPPPKWGGLGAPATTPG